MNGFVTLIVMALASYGIYWSNQKLGKKGEDSAALVQGNYNNVVNVGTVLLNVSPETFKAAVEGRFTKARAAHLAKKALEFIRPAQREGGAAIEGGGVRIEPETVAAAPSPLDMELEDDEELHDHHTNQEVIIHALDLDSKKTGWAGHLPGVWEKRLRMQLYPTVKAESLFGRRNVIADIILVSKRNDVGEYIPYMFHVVGVD